MQGPPLHFRGRNDSSDLRILKLKGYELILGVHWIHSYNPVTLDYKKMTMVATLENDQMRVFVVL